MGSNGAVYCTSQIHSSDLYLNRASSRHKRGQIQWVQQVLNDTLALLQSQGEPH
ncbi:MAG: hypothetical protein WBP64_03975 [Nitrososphaeraceae archaeon]